MTATENTQQQASPDEAPPGTVTLGDWVRVVNTSDSTIKTMWDGRTYKVHPGAEVFMPFEAAKLWFGDPRSGGNVASHRDVTGMVSWIPDRATEVRRLRALYDNQFGDEHTITNHPIVEVYTQAGDRLYTVLDDPDGERSSPAVQSVMDHATLLEQVKRQQATIDLLVQQAGIGGQTGGNVEPNAEPNAEPVPEDETIYTEPILTDELPGDPTTDRAPLTDDAGA